MSDFFVVKDNESKKPSYVIHSGLTFGGTDSIVAATKFNDLDTAQEYVDTHEYLDPARYVVVAASLYERDTTDKAVLCAQGLRNTLEAMLEGNKKAVILELDAVEVLLDGHKDAKFCVQYVDRDSDV